MRSRALLPLLLFVPLMACSSSADSGDDGDSSDDAITSNDAQIVDFSFDSALVTEKDTDAKKAITSQLFYTVGILTSNFDANGQVGRAQITNISETPDPGGRATKTVKFHVVTPVAWPKGRKVPRTQALSLPKDTTKLDDFNAKYDHKCGNDEYGQDVFWHDWNPLAQGCTTDAADVTKTTARVTKDKTVTTGKYPEYDQAWADGELDAVAIFGESDAGAAGDEGVAQFESFLAKAKDALPGSTLTENAKSDSIVRNVTIKASVAGKPVKVDIVLIGTLYEAGPDFDAWYDPLSQKADMVIYNGHSELSKNTNALARKGKVDAKKYQIFFFDSCDTYAYLDTSLSDRRASANPDDPKGTKYLDVVTNVLPSYFVNYAASSLSLFTALVHKDQPKTYNEILSEMPSDQVVVITGEEDNNYAP
jgi:hypothetical protein